MPDSTVPPKTKIDRPGHDPSIVLRPVLIPPEARVTKRMSQEILGALQEKGVAPKAHHERVAQLRAKAKTVAPALGRAVRALPREQFHERFALVNLMHELDDDATLPELVSVIETPAEKADPSTLSMLEKQRDTMIRTLAVEGVARLARRGSSAARAALEQQLHHATFSVRRAVQELLAIGGPDVAGKLRAALDPKEHFLLEVKVRDPREIMRSLHPTLPVVTGDQPLDAPLPGPRLNLASLRRAPVAELTEDDAPAQPGDSAEEADHA